ncbi:MAG: spore germination protein [Candidatus Petromonas sp.]|nr:spore germination protein [Candidatus Petromonas sp.]
MRKILSLFLLCIIPLFFSGCWDNIEIDERAFITGMGFDKYEEKEKKGEEEKETQVSNLKRYILTVTYPNVAMIAQKAEGDPSYIYSTVCASPSDGKQQINLRNNKNFYLNHSKVAIIGAELARDEKMMREILDVIQRSIYINRKIHIFITPQKAQEILTMDTGKNMDMGLFLEELIEKEITSPRRPETSFDAIITNLRESNASMFPRIAKGEKEVTTGGAAVLKGYKLVGWLDPIETRDVNILKGRGKIADYTIKIDKLYIVVEQMNLRSKMKAYEGEDKRINIDFEVEAEGILLQHYYGVPGEPFDSSYIEKINKVTEKQLTNEFLQVVEKIQKQYKTDIFKVGEYLRKFEPKTWEKVKNNWDEIYPETKVNIDVKMHVRRVGIEG